MGYKSYSDGTLMRFTKKELIEQIRILEHNWDCSKICLDRQYKMLQEYVKKEKEWKVLYSDAKNKIYRSC